MPSLAKISSKARVNLASRSRMKKRNEQIRLPRSMTRLRACCAVQAPSGRAVTPTGELFTREKDARHKDVTDLAWLTSAWGDGPPGTFLTSLLHFIELR
jgi:hypothetical protein